MIKDFNKTVILTTQNPEAFLNYRYEAADPSLFFYVTTDSSIPENVLFVNGLDINTYLTSDPSFNLYISNTGDPSVASFHLYTRKLYDFDYNLTIDISGGLTEKNDVSISNRPSIIKSDQINIYETANIQNDNETSFLILRTNPKFTGNIKIVVDSSDNLFLDTFKVSNILNNKKYRKQLVSMNSVFSGDTRKIFSSLPLGELYKLGIDDTTNISIPKTDLFRQYDMTYSYGAKLLEDDLYNDDYSILAPLWINSKLPDYFAIFRIDGAYNPETYTINPNIPTLANKYLENGEIIKSWGLKNETVLGTYLENHLNELLSIRSPLFISLGTDPNSWYGIAVDKGIITGRSEIPYFFDQKNNFTDINAFISQGYERLNLLCPNLLNLEYVFSDNDVSLYTMSRYFGLYLTDNELYQISYYADEPNASIQVLSLNDKNPSDFFVSTIFDLSTGDTNTSYQNRIFSLNDIEKIKRITNVHQIDGTNENFISDWVNKPGNQLFSSKVDQKYINKFITINLKNLLVPGEHLRIIDKTQFKIWEIYGLNSDLLENEDCWPYASYYSDPSGNYPTIYRTAFSIKGTTGDQIVAIKKAFDIFKNYPYTPFETTIYKYDDAQLSFNIQDWANNNDIWFQRLTAQTVLNPSDPSSIFNNAAKYNDIIFYGVLEPSVNDFERLRFDASYGPINFELYGDRMSMMINFFDMKNYNLYSFDSSVGTLFNKYTMYLGTDMWYRIINSFDISTALNHSFNYVISPNELDKKSLIKTSNQINTVRGIWNAYKPYSLSISLMGINPVKDIDFTVYDLSLGYKSEYWYNRSDDSSTYSISSNNIINISSRNSYEIISGNGSIYINDVSSNFTTDISSFKFNTFDGSAHIVPNNSNVIVTYNQIDGSYNYKSYTGLSEEHINNYYINTAKLKYSLTLPYVTKWVGLGTDCRNNEFRLLLDSSLLDASTNFIPYQDNFKGEISYPSFKYLNSGTKAWESYTYFDINDPIEYVEDNSTFISTIKDLMISNPYLDVFSKLIYSNNQINNVKDRSSIAFYSNYKQSIDTIISGLSLSFTIDEGAKNVLNIKDWDRFRISFISSPSRNRDNNYPIEIFVNENTQTIFIVWYQGSDTLNYSKRYSSYFGGKNLLEDSSIKVFESFKTGNRFWSYIKTPFIVNNSSLSTDIINLYDLQSSYDASICSSFNQLNCNFSDNIYSIFNAYDGNVALSNSFVFFNRQYNTFRQYVDYNYVKDSATFGNSVINYGNTYMQNTNIYNGNVCDLNLLSNLFIVNNIGYYIFRQNNIYTNNSFVSPPLIITINDPRNYKGIYTYNGWFKPKFNNILNFNCNEDGVIINALKTDFIFGNTYLNSYNNIPQLWYNKIVKKVSVIDVSTQNAIGFNDFNVFKSLWDSQYYIQDSVSVNGYNSSLELPSYFGSKLIKLPKTLTLDNWDVTTSKVNSLNKNSFEIQYNLTRKIINIFKSNGIFISNWSNLTSSDSVINNYIENTILRYYNISQPKINVNLWNKKYDGINRIAYNYDTSLIPYTQKNIYGQLSTINNEYYYTITVPALPNLTWFVSFELFEK